MAVLFHATEAYFVRLSLDSCNIRGAELAKGKTKDVKKVKPNNILSILRIESIVR